MTLRVFEAFSGIGTQSMALGNIGADYEIVGTSEWDINPVLAYNSIHTEDKKDYAKDLSNEQLTLELIKLGISSNGKDPLREDQIARMPIAKKRDVYNAFKNTKNLGSIVGLKLEDLPEFDLFTYSFPCQDISLSGKQKGFSKGSGTRSGMLWECQKIIEYELPKYLLLENVKNLVHKKFKPDFDLWLEYLEELGYTNYWQVINAKDYGVPQNRERVFVMSIRGEHEPFEFPEPFSEKPILKDVLERRVDEKYYLSDEVVSKFRFKDNGNVDKMVKVRKFEVNTSRLKRVLRVHKRKSKKSNNELAKNLDVPVTKVEHWFRKDNSFSIPSEDIWQDLKKELNINTSEFDESIEEFEFKPNTFEQSGRVHYEDKVYKTLTTSASHDVLEPKQNRLFGIYDKPKVRRQAGAVWDKDGLSPTIDTAQGGNRQPLILVNNATKKGYLEATEGDAIDIGHLSSTTKRGRVQKERSHTVTTQDHIATLDGFRIRKLTPKECYRLMGVSDKHFRRARQVSSNTQLYKQAGNAIVVNVLEEIFKAMLETEV